MKSIKKTVAFIVLLAILLCMNTAMVFAESMLQDGIEVTISTDKEKYAKDDIITVELSVENTNDYKVNHVSVENIVPKGYALEGNSKSNVNIGTLEAKATKTVITTYKVKEGNTVIKTSSVPKAPKKASQAKTGDTANIFFWTALLAVSIIVIAVFFRKRKIRNKILSLFLCLILTGAFLEPMEASAAPKEDIKQISAGKTVKASGKDLQLKSVVSYEKPAGGGNSEEVISYTRAQWIQKLVDSYGYPMIEDNTEHSYSDIAGKDYEKAVETAVAYGVLTPKGETFEADSPATREFAAVTAVRALGYYPAEEIQCDDLQDITYPQETFLAVDIGLLALEDNKFYPARPLKDEEGKNILNIIEKTYNSTETGSGPKPEDFVFRDGVIRLDEATQYTDDGSVLTLPLTDELKTLEKGNIIVIGYSDAYKVEEFSIEDDKVIVHYNTPELNEFLESVNTEGQAAMDFSKFIPADNVELNYNSAENGIQTMGFMDDMFDVPPTTTDVESNISLGGDIDLGNDWKVDFSLDAFIQSVDYKFDIDFDFIFPKVKNAYVKVRQNTTVKVGFGKNFEEPDYGNLIRDDMLYKYIPLGKVPIVGIYGVGAVVEIDLVMNAQGKFELEYNLGGTLGCQVLNNRPRNITALQSSTSIGLMGEIKVGPKMGLVVELFSQDIISFSADAGVRVGASVDKRSTGMVCVDAGLSLYAELNAFEHTLIDDWLKVAAKWTIWDKNSSPVKISGHWENMNWVDACTYENGGTIKGTVADAEDRARHIKNAKIEVFDSETLTLEQTVKSDDSGQYTAAVPGGTHLVKVSAEGYIPFESLETVMDKQEVFVETYLMVQGEEGSTEKGSIGGYITDSVTGSAITDAALTIRKGWNKISGDIISTVSTDENGYYQTELLLGNYTVIMEKNNYVTNHINIAVTRGSHMDKHGTMVPTGESTVPTGDMRIVLTWGEHPSDLDSHLCGPMGEGNGKFHIYYVDQAYYFGNTKRAFLDLDDTTSYGPETTTVYSMNQNGRYSYYVHNYSSLWEEGSTSMANSGVKVQVYFGETLAATYNIPTGGVGNLWHVFDFDAGTRQLKAVNDFSTENNPSHVGGMASALSISEEDLAEKYGKKKEVTNDGMGEDSTTEDDVKDNSSAEKVPKEGAEDTEAVKEQQENITESAGQAAESTKDTAEKDTAEKEAADSLQSQENAPEENENLQ